MNTDLYEFRHLLPPPRILVERMSCQPLRQHKAQRRDQATKHGDAYDLPARPADQAKTALAAATPFRNSCHNPLLSKSPPGEAFRLSGSHMVELGSGLEVEAEFGG